MSGDMGNFIDFFRVLNRYFLSSELFHFFFIKTIFVLNFFFRGATTFFLWGIFGFGIFSILIEYLLQMLKAESISSKNIFKIILKFSIFLNTVLLTISQHLSINFKILASGMSRQGCGGRALCLQSFSKCEPSLSILFVLSCRQHSFENLFWTWNDFFVQYLKLNIQSTNPLNAPQKKIVSQQKKNGQKLRFDKKIY